MSDAFGQHLAELEMRQSVGRTGICWDNAVAESFWSSLKRELVHRHRFATRAHARRAIFAWINWYNQHRLHSTLGYLSPTTWEKQYRQKPSPTAARRPHNPVSGQRGDPQCSGSARGGRSAGRGSRPSRVRDVCSGTDSRPWSSRPPGSAPRSVADVSGHVIPHLLADCVK